MIDCKGCRATCCFLCNIIPELNKFDSGNGRCKHLTTDYKCSIYTTRPFVCSNEQVYQTHYSHISKQEYIDFTKNMCNTYNNLIGEIAMKSVREEAKKLREIKFKGIMYQEFEYIIKQKGKLKLHKNNIDCSIYYFKDNQPKYIRYKSKKKDRVQSFNSIKLLVKGDLNNGQK